MLPDNMETFGASELPAKTLEWVPFAFVEDTRGGLTESFFCSVPGLGDKQHGCCQNPSPVQCLSHGSLFCREWGDR